MSVTTDEGTGEISESDCTACGGTGYGACNGTFEAGKTTEPTCTEPGSTVYTCATYGASYEEEIPAKGHTVENWETTKEPTCTVCGAQEAALEDTGVSIVRQGAEGLTYNIGEGQVIMLASPDDTYPIVFGNCTFDLTGKTVKISGNQNGISYNNGETITKLWIGSNVQFANCTFLTDETGSKSSSLAMTPASTSSPGTLCSTAVPSAPPAMTPSLWKIPPSRSITIWETPVTPATGS
ncbi:MAG: hypothetical protein Q3X94_00415 [Oscillospiraceae bacterium]|nr:hypothetical protein [Oscillospiraceae bacterium]